MLFRRRAFQNPLRLKKSIGMFSMRFQGQSARLSSLALMGEIASIVDRVSLERLTYG